MKKIIYIVFIVVMLNLTSSMAFANMENASTNKRQSFDAPFLNLTANNIEAAKISAHLLRRPLNSGEVKSLVGLLNQVDLDDISEYKGPSPKGGPISITVFLKSNENFTLILNGDYFLYSGKVKNYQAYQPELRKFAISLLNGKRYLNTTGLPKRTAAFVALTGRII